MKYGKLLHQEGISNVEVNAGIVSEVLSSSNGTYTHILTLTGSLLQTKSFETSPKQRPNISLASRPD
jgi:hypothetical protein